MKLDEYTDEMTAERNHYIKTSCQIHETLQAKELDTRTLTTTLEMKTIDANEVVTKIQDTITGTSNIQQSLQHKIAEARNTIMDMTKQTTYFKDLDEEVNQTLHKAQAQVAQLTQMDQQKLQTYAEHNHQHTADTYLGKLKQQIQTRIKTALQEGTKHNNFVKNAANTKKN